MMVTMRLHDICVRENDRDTRDFIKRLLIAGDIIRHSTADRSDECVPYNNPNADKLTSNQGERDSNHSN